MKIKKKASRPRTGVLVIALVLGVGMISALSAQTAGPKPQDNDQDRQTLKDRTEKILEAEKDKTLAELTVADATRLINELSIAKQEYAWVKRSEGASLIMPGLGQYMNGDDLGGTLYLTGGIVLFAGTLVGAYFALPEDLRSIHYFQDSSTSIHNAWGDHSFSDYLPSIGVFVGGMVLQGVLRLISADQAGNLARDRIRDKKITFEPDLLVLTGPGEPFFGIRGRMRY